MSKTLIIACAALLALNVSCEKEEAKVASAPPPPVNVVVPAERKVQEFDEFTGRVAAVESVDIRARVGGYIQTIGFKDGDEVKKGQLLFQIDPRPYQATLDATKAGLAAANAELAFAKDELARIEPAAKAGAASMQELEKAKDQLARAEARISGANAEIEKAQLDLDYAAVQSPIDGRISKSSLSVGNLIAGDTLLTSVVSLNPIQVNFDVDERRLLIYRADARKRGQDNLTRIREANVPVWVAMSNEKDFPHQGVLDFVDNQVDQQTGTIRARAEFENQKRILLPGQYVRVRIRRGEPQNGLLVPDRAVGKDQDRKFLLVLDGKNVVQYRNVETGGLDGEDRVILQGLSAGEQVIVDGLQRARPGQTVTPTQVTATSQPAPTSQPAK
jgi:RND family efflux transporter MFP subunit